jgi:hypothetical protein|tara:strand:- start:119 stop:340 length:222 start_codon:yes stop_codon:yes gene_type:complete
MDAKEYLHSDAINEFDTIFDPPVKCEYSEEQLIRFAELWAASVLIMEANNNGGDPYDGKTRTGGLSPDTGPRA